MVNHKKDKKGKKDLDDLKRELELDEHRVPLDDLFRRLKCDPNKVIWIFENFFFDNKAGDNKLLSQDTM